MERIKKTLEGFSSNEILFNNDLLKKIIDIPSDKLTEGDFNSLLKREFPELFDCLVLLNDKSSVSRLVELLSSKSYYEWETDFLNCNITTTRQLNSESEFSKSIDHHLQARFELSQFFRAVSELSMTREGFIQSFNKYSNIRALSSFAGVIIDKIIHDLQYDINKTLELKPQQYKFETYNDFDSPEHQLIKKYSLIRKKDTFLKKWLIDFRICKDLIFDVTTDGMGYSPILIRNKENLPLSGEGTGTKKLISMLLEIATASEYCELRDFNSDKKFNSRTLVIEEPEAYLHPSWQSKLGDMFIDAKNRMGLNFIIETHSEYIINKIQYLVSIGKLSKNDVMVYYFDKEGSELRITEIMMDEKGNLSKEIPGAFIDEEDWRSVGLFKLKKIGKN
ncbi:MAG TPA: AAA family ATPase [Bacteroidales bacterium]|nr:AAA family ATPase [Bacteroidales bacterium]